MCLRTQHYIPRQECSLTPAMQYYLLVETRFQILEYQIKLVVIEIYRQAEGANNLVVFVNPLIAFSCLLSRTSCLDKIVAIRFSVFAIASTRVVKMFNSCRL